MREFDQELVWERGGEEVRLGGHKGNWRVPGNLFLADI